jgi:hypothetical protein
MGAEHCCFGYAGINSVIWRSNSYAVRASIAGESTYQWCFGLTSSPEASSVPICDKPHKALALMPPVATADLGCHNGSSYIRSAAAGMFYTARQHKKAGRRYTEEGFQTS